MESTSEFNLRRVVRFLVLPGSLFVTLGGIWALWEKIEQAGCRADLRATGRSNKLLEDELCAFSAVVWIPLGIGAGLLLVGLTLNAGLRRNQR